VSAALVGSVLLVYCVPFFGFLISFAVLIALVVMRRDLWGAAGPRIALLAVLVWVGLWLPAITYIPTAWYLTLTGRELSTSWLALPLWAPSPIAAGTPGPCFGGGRGVRHRVDGVCSRGSAVAGCSWRLARSMGPSAGLHQGHRDGLILGASQRRICERAGAELGANGIVRPWLITTAGGRCL
jgi:hypothetical protein